MVVLGIDPGLSITGYGIMRHEKQRTQVIDYGLVRFSRTMTLPQKVARFHHVFTQKITDHQVTLLALETPFLGKNAQNFLKLGYLRGIAYLLADQQGIAIQEFAPRQVKLAVTGSGAAQKDQVARVMMRLFRGIEMPKTFDVTDALAVALCGAWKGARTAV